MKTLQDGVSPHSQQTGFGIGNGLFQLLALLLLCPLLLSCIRNQSVLMNDTTEHRLVEIYSNEGTPLAWIRVDANSAVTLPQYLPNGIRLFGSGLCYRLLRDDGQVVGTGRIDSITNQPDSAARSNAFLVHTNGRLLLQIRESEIKTVTEPLETSRGEWILSEHNREQTLEQ